jgi:hypothetical protein
VAGCGSDGGKRNAKINDGVINIIVSNDVSKSNKIYERALMISIKSREINGETPI